MQPVIIASSLVKSYNGKNAVDGIDFEVAPGEAFGLLGPNGAGKTTTVRMIYGFTPITSGKLEVLGFNAARQSRQIKRRLGIVPQEDNLDLNLTVEENLIVYAAYFNIGKEVARERARELLGFFDLEEKAKAEVGALSGGMKRRLTIARGLINDPEILILDEPTTGLDPQARHLVWQRLRQLHNNGVTLLLTTHYLEEATQLCDRLVILERGKILEEGQPRALIDQHIGKEILELRNQAGRREEFTANLNGLITGYQTVGENLFLYPKEGEELLRELDRRGFPARDRLLRPATLEDVFLKLAGREFADEANDLEEF